MTQNSGKYIKSKPNRLILNWVMAVIYIGFETWLWSLFPISIWQAIIGICVLFLASFIGLWMYGRLHNRVGLQMVLRFVIFILLYFGLMLFVVKHDTRSAYIATTLQYATNFVFFGNAIYSIVNSTITYPLYKREGRAIETTVEKFLNAVIHDDESLVNDLSMQVDNWGLELNLLSDYLPDEQNSDIDMGNELRFKSIGGSGLPVWFKRLRCSATATVKWELDRAGKLYNLWTGLAKTPSGWKLYDVMIMSAHR